MKNLSCGIDFGTSNSSVALAQAGKIGLVAVEDAHDTTPSAIFFRQADNKPFFGRAAVKMFFDREEGRFMRSLKRVLGTSLMKHGTLVNNKLLKFDVIIASFLKNLKVHTDFAAGKDVENVVMGRPVHFIDNDPEGDKRAQSELQAIAGSVGFRNIDFQFEPIAAAFAHEVKLTSEKLAIVADLGGGTSDFTVIRLSNKYLEKADRTSDILANTGVRVGGNDFDKNLSMRAMMPELGYGSTYGEKHLEVPLKPYHDLAEWSKVNFLYTAKTIAQTRQLLHQSHDKKRFGRLLELLERETGHALLAMTEDSKIALTAQTEHNAVIDFLTDAFTIGVTRRQFEDAIHVEIEKVINAARRCLQLAQVQPEAIDLMILTGGSTEVPYVQSEFRKLFPKALLADENKLSSVGLGLAYDSQYKFG